MTTRMVQIPEEDWHDLISAADQLHEAIELPEVQPTTHIFQPMYVDLYYTYLCGNTGCGASQQNPIHYV